MSKKTAFQIPDFTTVKINSVNHPTENHGPDKKVPVLALNLTLVGANTLLDMFEADMRKTFYCKRAGGQDAAGQGNLEVSDVDAPNVRLQTVEMPLKLNTELSGYTCLVDYGRGGEANLKLADCELKSFQLTLHEGGTVEVKFSLTTSTGLDERVVGKLGLMTQHETKIQLLPPEPKDAKQTVIAMPPVGRGKVKAKEGATEPLDALKKAMQEGGEGQDSPPGGEAPKDGQQKAAG